jgi:two-component system OmpR family response regulator
MRVLVLVERGLADAVRQILEREGHSLHLAHSGNQALQSAEASAFDAVVVDTTPGFDGFEAVRILRSAGVRTPILMLIAKETVRDASKVAEAGADDFLTKPFSLVELVARLRAMFGRTPVREPSRLQVADLVFDASTHQVSRAGVDVVLTRKEFQLLEILLRNSSRVVHRDELLKALWGGKKKVDTNALDAFIRLLRRKVDRGHEVQLIHTVRGVGYRLSDPAEPKLGGD